MQLDPDFWSNMLFMASFALVYVSCQSKFGKNTKYFCVALFLGFVGQASAIYLHTTPSSIMFFFCGATLFTLIWSGIDLRKEGLATHKQEL